VVVRLRPAEVPVWVRDRLAPLTGTRWVGVDGFGAAGKSTLAAAIAAALPGSAVVEVDDFGRAGLTGWDRDLFTAQVLEPLLAGRSARYRRWDLVTDRPGEGVEVPPGGPVIIEGVSSTDIRVAVPWDVTLWVEVPADVRWRRIQDRDPPELQRRWRTDWLPSERAYAAGQRPAERVDAVVDGGLT
jgi:uridine kinase